MCGIAGYIGTRPPDAAARSACLAAMAHRGPDGSGAWEGKSGDHCAVLLHTRLAIIDLDPRADQPFAADGCQLVYNGELYNYIELREILESKGHSFRTDSDTEVVLRAYLEWGEGAFDRFEGMWTLAIFDERRGDLLLSRDRFGEKPLYLLDAPGGMYFASEIKALRALCGVELTVSEEKTHRFIAHGYRAIFRGIDSFFDGVSLFPAAHFGRTRGDELTTELYWEPHFQPVDMSFEDAVDGAASHIDRAIRMRLRADVPVAISLSGGIDSNVLAGIAVHRHGQSLHSFSMLESDARYDESAAIRSAAQALGTPHHETRVSRDGFLDRLSQMARFYDGPVPSLGMYLDGFLSEAVAAGGYKVLINGNGADEVFLGYYDQYLFWLAGQQHADGFDGLVSDWQAGLGAHVRNPVLQNPRAFIDSPNERSHLHLNAPDVSRFLSAPVERDFQEIRYCDDPLRMRMLNELLRESVPVLTWAHDSHYMAHSIENRAAYLDRGLVDYMMTVPSRHLIHDGLTKALLRRAGEGVVPPEILGLKKKLGFNAPISSLLDRDDQSVRDRILADSTFWDIVDRTAVQDLLNPDTKTAGKDNLLFCIVSARVFYEACID